MHWLGWLHWIVRDDIADIPCGWMWTCWMPCFPTNVSCSENRLILTFAASFMLLKISKIERSINITGVLAPLRLFFGKTYRMKISSYHRVRSAERCSHKRLWWRACQSKQLNCKLEVRKIATQHISVSQPTVCTTAHLLNTQPISCELWPAKMHRKAQYLGREDPHLIWGLSPCWEARG